MSRMIWKFPITISDEPTIINAPVSHVLHVGLDPNGVPCVWVEVDPARQVEPTETPWRLRVHGTGHPITDDEFHLGSFVQGQFVWHVYEDAS